MSTGSPEGMNEIDETSIDPEEQGSQMQPYDTLDDRGVEDVLDEGIVPNQKWSPGQGFGNTAAEQREGETLDMRIAQEEPDVLEQELGSENLEDAEVGDARAGRLVAPDEGAHEDAETDAVAYDVGIDGAGATAEEAAMHVVDDEDEV
jgi:Family of unknown function (DUF5709)